MSDSRITASPKVPSSEVNPVTRNRAKTTWRTTPRAKNAGTRRPPARPGARRRELAGPHHAPLAVLHLLHPEEIVAVVVRAVEAQLADDRVHAVLLQPLREHFVVEALRRGHRGLQALPGRPRAGHLRLHVRVGHVRLRRALTEERP